MKSMKHTDGRSSVPSQRFKDNFDAIFNKKKDDMSKIFEDVSSETFYLVTNDIMRLEDHFIFGIDLDMAPRSLKDAKCQAEIQNELGTKTQIYRVNIREVVEFKQ